MNGGRGIGGSHACSKLCHLGLARGDCGAGGRQQTIRHRRLALSGRKRLSRDGQLDSSRVALVAQCRPCGVAGRELTKGLVQGLLLLIQFRLGCGVGRAASRIDGCLQVAAPLLLARERVGEGFNNRTRSVTVASGRGRVGQALFHTRNLCGHADARLLAALQAVTEVAHVGVRSCGRRDRRRETLVAQALHHSSRLNALALEIVNLDLKGIAVRADGVSLRGEIRYSLLELRARLTGIRQCAVGPRLVRQHARIAGAQGLHLGTSCVAERVGDV